MAPANKKAGNDNWFLLLYLTKTTAKKTLSVKTLFVKKLVSSSGW